MTELPDHPAPIDLARTPDFHLGAAWVSSSACQVKTNGMAHRVEPRVMQVLIVLARAAGRTVSRDELIGICWGGRFVSDDAVARAISQVRALARDVEPPPFTLQTVPKVGFRLVLPEQGDDAAPPEAGRVTRPRPAHLLLSVPPRLRWVAAVLGVLLIATVLGTLWFIGTSNRRGDQNGRVEVMLFEPLQDDAALKRYATLLSDAVVRMLAGNGVEAVQKPARRDLGEGGAELRVAGTVYRDGDKYVVNAQVISRRSGDVLWSGRFDRAATAPVGFQEEAANRIDDALRCALWHRTAERKFVSDRVLSLMLNACTVWRGDPEPLLGPTEQLVAAAPDHSYAHSMHAIALALAASRFAHANGSLPTARAAELEAKRALELDPRNAEAYQALAIRYFRWGHRLEREENVLRGAALPPLPPSFYNLYVETLREVGRWDDATQINRRTIAADSFSPFQPSSLAVLRAAAGDLQEARLLADRTELLAPDMGHELKATIAFWWGEPADALKTIEQYRADLPRDEARCYAAYLSGLGHSAAKRRGLPPDCASMDMSQRVRMLAREGDIDGAYAVFGADPNGRYDTTALFYPEMKAFRRDPRFMPLATRVGLVDYWVKSGRWPDFCREPGLPYDCKAEARRVMRAAR